MSSQVKVLPRHLRSLAQQMRRANNQSLGFIASGIKTIKNNNDQVASMRESRINIVRDTMMDRMDLVGLQALTSSFSASYNQMETNKPLLNRAIDQTLPTMMEQRFFSVNRFSLPKNINDTRWLVGGRRWEAEADNLYSQYNTISFKTANITGQVGDQLTVLDNFSKRGHHTRGIGPAANAFYSVLSHISEEMIRPIPEGLGSSRSGSMDVIPDMVANVADVCARHVELVAAKSEEIATQVHALGDDREAFEHLAANLFTNAVNNIQHESLIRNSQVELALYRPELLSDGMGIESAKQAQHEQRYEALKAGLIQHFFPLVDYLASQSDLFITDIPQLCEEVVREIDRWLALLSLPVTVEVRVEHEGTVLGAPLTRWESKPISARTLGDYIPETMDDIKRARDILNRWGEAFRITIRRARELRDAMNRNDHIGPLSERIERALYLPETYDILQTFATQAREHLENLAEAYQGGANQIRSHMSGNTVTACTREIDSIAKYFRAIAQAIEKDFGNGNFSGEVNKLSTFPVRSSTRLAWGRKTAEELMAMLINNGEVNWELLEELIGDASYQDITNEMFEAVTAVFMELDDNDMSTFLRLLAHQSSDQGVYLEWEIDTRILARLQGNILTTSETARRMEQHLEGMEKEQFFKALDERERAELVAYLGLGNNVSDARLWDRLLDHLEEQQIATFQRRAILTAIGNANLVSTPNGTGPAFNIVQNPDYSFTISLLNPNVAMMPVGPSGTLAPHSTLQMTAISISPIRPYYDVFDIASNMMNADLVETFSFDVWEHLVGEVINLGQGEGIGRMELPSSVAPATGIVLGAVDIVSSTAAGVAESRENLAMLDAHMENISTSYTASHLHLNGIFIDNGNSVPLMIFQPTTTTEGQLAEHNARRPNRPDSTIYDVIFDISGVHTNLATRGN